MPEPRPIMAEIAHKLPALVVDDVGGNHYTHAGQASGDLASALMALESVLARQDLTTAQRRDFSAARGWLLRAAAAVERHIDHAMPGRSISAVTSPRTETP